MRLAPLLNRFKEIWLADFEFRSPPGEPPTPICMVAKEIRSGRMVRAWEDDLRSMGAPPFGDRADAVLVAYYASAEIACCLRLGWSPPCSILDLYVEFRARANGSTTPCGYGLLGALAYFGIEGMDEVDKERMRDLAQRGGPWSSEEKRALLEYCEADVRALDNLLPRMLPGIDLERALLRGSFMEAAARIEDVGTPLDVPTLKVLREEWDVLKAGLIQQVDGEYGVYEGLTFRTDRFAAYLKNSGIAWPVLPSGRLQLDDDTFRQMARSHKILMPLRELRVSIAQLRLADLAVGSDGRNRTLLSPFQAKTGRNQPSNSRFIFGPARWLRSLIRPLPATALAYVDYEQQEFGIAAALSGDAAMIAAYESGDAYLGFAKQANLVPATATKSTHKAERERAKACILGTQYGIGEQSLAMQIGQTPAHARELLRLHRKTYSRFWRWSDGAVDCGVLNGVVRTVFGWPLHFGPEVSARTFRNFPMQANASEMLRVASSFALSSGVRICALIHDAILIEAPLARIEEAVRMTQDAMRRASEIVLGGFALRSEVKEVRYPARYVDDRGIEMWNTVLNLLRLRGRTL